MSDDTLRDWLVAARVGLESGGCCPVEGPCEACDCFDPKHQMAKQEIDALMPVILADRQWSVDEAIVTHLLAAALVLEHLDIRGEWDAPALAAAAVRELAACSGADPAPAPADLAPCSSCGATWKAAPGDSSICKRTHGPDCSKADWPAPAPAAPDPDDPDNAAGYDRLIDALDASAPADRPPHRHGGDNACVRCWKRWPCPDAPAPAPGAPADSQHAYRAPMPGMSMHGCLRCGIPQHEHPAPAPADPQPWIRAAAHPDDRMDWPTPAPGGDG